MNEAMSTLSTLLSRQSCSPVTSSEVEPSAAVEVEVTATSDVEEVPSTTAASNPSSHKIRAEVNISIQIL